ncbi:unnamed protein product [Pleuronectes platessa]|uniref:Uncharacterized protein n=1 Tax=Pleuronectes platessa TaxID=8262 RepID=A0A9N7UWK3_PLEPL|nr:unnamed protein product [Pleuronectes platessa]
MDPQMLINSDRHYLPQELVLGSTRKHYKKLRLRFQLRHLHYQLLRSLILHNPRKPSYIGHIKTDPAKFKAEAEWPTPTSRRQLACARIYSSIAGICGTPPMEVLVLAPGTSRC